MTGFFDLVGGVVVVNILPLVGIGALPPLLYHQLLYPWKGFCAVILREVPTAIVNYNAYYNDGGNANDLVLA